MGGGIPDAVTQSPVSVCISVPAFFPLNPTVKSASLDEQLVNIPALVSVIPKQ